MVVDAIIARACKAGLDLKAGPSFVPAESESNAHFSFPLDMVLLLLRANAVSGLSHETDPPTPPSLPS